MKKTRVMLVESNEQIANILGRLLEMRGYEFIWTGDCSKAVEMASSAVDVVIIDDQLNIFFGGKSGAEVTRAIRQKDLKMPIIITANVPEAIRDEVTAAGANEILQIPFMVDELFGKIGPAMRE